MTASSYPPTTSFTIAEEGGYTNDSRDSGNWSSGIVGQGTLIGSNMGCGAPATLAYLKANFPNVTLTAAYMQALPRSIYDGMALHGYWYPLQGDAMLTGLDLMNQDFGWNTGIGSAAKRLQWLIGATQDGQIGAQTLDRVSACALAPIAKALTKADAITLQQHLGVTVDGSVGPATLAALAAANDATIRPVVLCLGLSEAQTAYYKSLFNFNIYGLGWLARTGRRLAAGIALVTGATSAVSAMRLTDRAPRVPDEPDDIRWHPFEPGVPISDQAARIAA